MIENFIANNKDFKVEIRNNVFIFNYFNKKYYIGKYQREKLNKQHTLQSDVMTINKSELNITLIEKHFKILFDDHRMTGNYDIKYPRVAPLSFECVMETINVFGEYQFNFLNSEYWIELNRKNGTLRMINIEKSDIYDFSSLQVFQRFYNYQFVINFTPTLEFLRSNTISQIGEMKSLKQKIEEYDEAIVKGKDMIYELCCDDRYYIIQKYPEIHNKLEFSTRNEQISYILKIFDNIEEVFVYPIIARKSSANFTPTKLRNILQNKRYYNFIHSKQELRVTFHNSMYILQTGFRKMFFESFEDMMKNHEFPIIELLKNEQIRAEGK